ncbi:CRAL/TRIO domain-containing protein, partial [Ramicandelaber brevisporus]
SPTTMRQAYHFHNQFDHPDAVFLRVLRARKWNVDQAYTMLLEVLGWRISFDVAGILTRGEPAIPRHLWDDGLGFIHGVDRSGRPICHVRIKHCHPSKQPVLQLQQFTVLCLENCRLFMHGSVEKYTILLDMAGFSLSNLDLSFVQWYVKAFSMYMPETLGLFVIYRAPWIFTPAWKIIAPWLDPVVAGKVVFVSSAEELQKVVDPKYLPVSVGGSYATEYSYEAPDKAEEELIDSIKKDADGREKALEKRIQAAEALDDVTRRLHAALDEKASAGDVDGLADERSKLSAEYTQAVVDLDYFIRGRTRYHRNG